MESDTSPENGSHLLSLPQELRLIIYDHLLHDNYRLDWPRKKTPPTTQPPPNEPPPKEPSAPDQSQSSLAILQTCKTIHGEASSILYRRALFHFHLQQTYIHDSWAQAPISASDFTCNRLMNVDVTTFMAHHEDADSSERLLRDLESLASCFSGPSILRSMFRLRLDPSWRKIQSARSEVVTALSGLVGFQKVVIRFHTMSLRGWGVKTGTRWQDIADSMGPEMRIRRDFYEELVRKMVHWLELRLGDGTVQDMEMVDVLFARFIEFHPRGCDDC